MLKLHEEQLPLETSLSYAATKSDSNAEVDNYDWS